jgi:hypothetical protein
MFRRSSIRRLLDDIGPVDQVGIEERVAKYATRSIKKDSKLFGLRLATSMVDLSSLEGKDTLGKVGSLCRKALPHIPPNTSQHHAHFILISSAFRRRGFRCGPPQHRFSIL